MIAQLTGVVAQVGPTSAVVEVGGLGVLAVCSPNTVAGLRIGQRATLATSLVVREDSLTLYGFASADEREFFELLLTATGRRSEARPGRTGRAQPRRAAPGDRHREPGPAVQGARHRPQGRATDRDRAQGQDQRGRADRRSGTPTGRAAAWRDQVTQGLQGLGWSARDAEAACDEVEHLVSDDPHDQCRGADAGGAAEPGPE